ncbi:MAG TPA: DUF4159 domain-containing protein [Dehalococcoidia bacterium]|jgi:hypothetical protein
MDLSALTRFRLRRVNPYRGLIIDETTWADAHDYHRDHLRLHALAFHSAGIVAGLEVRPTPSQPGSVDIAAGVALDAEGNMIVVGQDRRVAFDGIEAGNVYIALTYVENRVNAEADAPKGAPMNRIVESYKIEAVNKPIEEPAVELARMTWSSAEAVLKAAADPAEPRADEIDLRFRVMARAARPATVNVGMVTGEGDNSHVRGLTNLMREIDNVAGYQARFRGVVDLEGGGASSDLLYLCAPVLGDNAITTVASHLGRGGTVVSDACQANEAEVSKASMQMAERLGLHLKPLKLGDPLLDSRYPFAEAPDGAAAGDVLTSGRFVLSQRDYGCAWAGAAAKKTLPRDTVRAALEWGVNLAVVSVQPPPRG